MHDNVNEWILYWMEKTSSRCRTLLYLGLQCTWEFAKQYYLLQKDTFCTESLFTVHDIKLMSKWRRSYNTRFYYHISHSMVPPRIRGLYPLKFRSGIEVFVIGIWENVIVGIWDLTQGWGLGMCRYLMGIYQNNLWGLGIIIQYFSFLCIRESTFLHCVRFRLLFVLKYLDNLPGGQI